MVNHGLLYTWAAAINGSTTEMNQGVCPTGWHIPSNNEWSELENYLINNGYGFDGSGDDIPFALSSNSLWNASSSPSPGAPCFFLLMKYIVKE